MIDLPVYEICVFQTNGRTDFFLTTFLAPKSFVGTKVGYNKITYCVFVFYFTYLYPPLFFIQSFNHKNQEKISSFHSIFTWA